MSRSKITPEMLASLSAGRARSETFRSLARSIGVSPSTVQRALSTAYVVKPSEPAEVTIPNRIRTADEFQESISIRARRRDLGVLSWSLETIRAARDAQMRGQFQTPVALARAMRTEGPLFTAYCNRLAPQSSVDTQLVPASGARGATAARKAALSVFAARPVLKGIQGTLANHGVAIGYNQRQAKADGTRIDFRVTEWPLEHVIWNNSEECLQTTTRDGQRVNIVHGDGDWIVFRKQEELPWTQEAAILPAALLWAVLAGGLQDWAGASRSHGQPKLIGELPAGLALQIKNAAGDTILSPEAVAFVQMLQDLITGDAGSGIRPAGAKTDLLVNGSTAWQVFSELRNSAQKIAAQIYLGTDATLGSIGGAPGVDISELFGMASTILKGDFGAIEEGLNTGAYQPWAAVNYGDSTYAPSFKYLVPDADADGKSAEQSAKRTRLFDSLDRMRTLNLSITQDDVNTLATEYGVTNPPTLGVDAATQLQIPDSAISGLVLGREARTAQGLPPFGDIRDTMTLDEIAIYAKGRADAAVAREKAAATGEANVAVAQVKATPA